MNRERITGMIGAEGSLDSLHQKALNAVTRYDSGRDLPDSVARQLAHLSRNVPNIAVLYYGGTLGMKPDSSGNLVPTDNVDELLAPLKVKNIDKDVNVVWFQVTPEPIDSTNGRWPHWVTIGHAIKRLYNDFEDEAGGINGFVVAGGTDTMAHMTAALKYMLPNAGRPIISTGAQKPIFEPGSDAESNLFFSLGVAMEDLGGVQQAFGNVLRDGLRIHKVRDRNFQAFECPDGFQLGEFNSDGIILYEHAPRRNPYVTSNELEFYPNFREGIKVSKLSPATRSASLLYDALDPLSEAMLLVTYGAGNVRTEGLTAEEITHMAALRTLYEERYPVVLGSAMIDGTVGSNYATGALAADTRLEIGGAGAISAASTTGASLEVKMMRCLALAHANGSFDYDVFRAQMERNHVGEIRTRSRLSR